MNDDKMRQYKIAYSVREASEISGLSPATIHKLCNEGRLTRRKVGKRTFILAADLMNFFLNCPQEKHHRFAAVDAKKVR
ncbi:helix-turn-helix domain-containing protein [Ciceribacter thiooxidans]|uniref:Helix-turn-helix domain-containing protein n=1 Tax=Ciceribacter thiooxidans TaxID=1969821 RepID=A0ABV7HWR6_9HYPH|nr:helix-turn-helix domain-containing protein [Ciceribacter thiooxidans]